MMLISLVAVGLSLIMAVIHVGGSYLGLRESVIPRKLGTYVSIYEALYYAAMIPLLLGSALTIPLMLFALIHWAGAYVYAKGYLGKAATPNRLKLYGAYELAELLFILLIMAEII